MEGPITIYNKGLKGKHYVEGILEFEGEYLYEKKFDGVGYDTNGNVLYELKNGNGKVREYDKYNVLIFEGEYLDSKKNGKGKEYNSEGKIEYEGEFLNGKRNGKGKEYFLGKLSYEGEYLNGKKHGEGREYHLNGITLSYKSGFFKGYRNGYGTIYNRKGIIKFKGEFSFGKPKEEN